MASPHGPTAEQRTQLRTFVANVRTSQALADQIRADPVGAMRDAGLPDDMIAEILEQDGYDQIDLSDPTVKPRRRKDGEMSTHRRCTITCLCSNCCISDLGM